MFAFTRSFFVIRACRRRRVLGRKQEMLQRDMGIANQGESEMKSSIRLLLIFAPVHVFCVLPKSAAHKATKGVVAVNDR